MKEEARAKLYFNGTILTMDDTRPLVQAVATLHSEIYAVGTITEVQSLIQNNLHPIQLIERVDLQGKCMLPGFYDPHSHIFTASVYNSLPAKLDSHPTGKVATISDIQQILRIQSQSLAEGKLILGMNYSDLGLSQKRHPTRKDLDEVSTKHPIIIYHFSLHIAVVNSVVLEEQKVKEHISDSRLSKGISLDEEGEPDGVINQLAMNKFTHPYIGKYFSDPEHTLGEVVKRGIKQYVSFGLTTIVEGAVDSYMGHILSTILKKEVDGMEIIGYAVPEANNQQIVQKEGEEESAYRTVGRKIIFDGSIQGYTAYLKQKYFTQPDKLSKKASCCQSESLLQSLKDKSPHENHQKQEASEMKQSELQEWRGEGRVSLERATQLFLQAFSANTDVLCHCNGDEASQVMIQAVQASKKAYPTNTSRVTMNHAQLVSEEQLDRMKQLDIGVSFFSSHIYYWGDYHSDLFLGNKRAEQLNPVRWALDRKIPTTIHNDVPVTRQNIFELIWCAVHRETQTGRILGPYHRMTVEEALKAVTLSSAYQGHEEERKGSIAPGKKADLIILNREPSCILGLRFEEVRHSIYVLQTIKGGRSIYRGQ